MSANTVVLSLTLENCIKITKWKVKEGTIVSVGRIILLYDPSPGNGKPEVRKLKATAVGTVRKLLVKEGDVIQPGDPLLELEKCTHPTVMKDMCAECGADLRNDESCTENTASIPMVHSVPELKVNAEQAQILGKADEERLLTGKKLVLLVDLDQTLIHTTDDNIPENLKDVYHFRLHGSKSPWHHTRLRPGINSFLQEMSKYYELHICTFGSRMYAHQIAYYLDPDRKYFSHRILSRDECFSANSKTANLKALFPCGDNMVCIIDDREDVWNFAPNLIHVKPYHFFQHTGDINAPPGLAKQENDDKGGYDFNRLGDGKKGKRVQKNDSKETLQDPQKVAVNLVKRKTDDMLLAKELVNNAASDAVNEKDTPSKESRSQPEIEDENSQALEDSPLTDEILIETETETKAEEEESCGSTGEKNGVDIKDELPAKPLETSQLSAEGQPQETVSAPVTSTDKLLQQNEDNNWNDNKAADISTASVDTDGTEHIAQDKQEKDVSCTKTEVKVVTELLSESRDEESKDVVKSALDLNCKDQIGSEKVKPDSCNNISSSKDSKKEEVITKPDEIEVEDNDDYLLYLEEILKRIHKEFYDRVTDGQKPDMKDVVPAVRKKVLAGTNLVFSGLVPNNIPLEKSRAYQVAINLGAKVTQDLQKTTTHLVAVRPGTAKVNSARRMKNVYLVTADWLWVSAERWERVDEKVFPLSRNRACMRHPPAHCGSPEQSGAENSSEPTTSTGRSRTASGRFMDTINPLLSFSSADIADMDQEVNDIFNESESDGEDDESSKKRKKPVVPERESETEEDSQLPDFPPAEPKLEEDSESSSSSADSLSGEHPHGWGKHNLKRKKSDYATGTGTATESDGEENDDMPSAKFRRGEALPSDLDLGENESESQGSEDPPDEIDDGDWNMMGAALEREFLS